MVILVTGSSGQVGQVLRMLSIRYIQHNFVFFNSEEFDITNPVLCRKRVLELKPDVIINLAAYTAVDLAEENLERAFQVNTMGVEQLANICSDYKIILVHLSTDYIFDGLKNEPYTTVDIPNPINAYGASKWKGEQHILNYSTEFYIIRTSWIYSSFGNNFKKTMLKLAQNTSELKVISDQVGCPTSAEDLALAILKCITEKPKYGVYHFCGPEVLSWYEFAKKIFKENNINIKLTPITSAQYHAKAARPAYSVLKISEFFKDQ